MERRRRKPVQRRRRRPLLRAPRGRARLAATLAVVVVLALLPPVRRVLGAAWAGVQHALETARAAEARERELRRLARQYGISPELAAAVDRAARAEGVPADLAFRLVRVESAFVESAESPVGALGLTQLMPATAQELQPGIAREQLLQRDTNLRLGFRYFRRLLRYYDGDTRAALHAYNRGPGTVDRIRAEGGDPANGYASRVLGPAGASRVRPGSPGAAPPDSGALHEMAPARLGEGL